MLFFGFVWLPFILFVGLTLLVLAGKNEPDERRERPAALYLSFIALVGVTLLLAGAFLTANGLVELTDTSPTGFSISTGGDLDMGPDFDMGRRGRQLMPDSSFTTSSGANHDDDISQVITGLIFGGIAVALLRFHAPRLQALADDSVGPAARVYTRLLYLLCALTLLSGLVAAGMAAYAIFGMIAPETSGAGEVTDALRSFITALAMTAVSAWLFREAWTRSEDLAATARPEVGFVAPPADPPPPAE